MSNPSLVHPSSSNTFYLEDTVSIKDEPHKIGYVTYTWHQPDQSYELESHQIVHYKPDDNDPSNIVRTFLKTGELPRGYVVITLLTGPTLPVLIKEVYLTLLERQLEFGNSVKRTLTNSMSGVVINLGGTVDLEPQLQSRRSTIDADSSLTIRDVDIDDLIMPTEWEEGEYVIWKNCWLGIIEDVVEDVTVRVDSGVVTVDDPSLLRRVFSTTENTNSTGLSTFGTNRPSLSSEWGPGFKMADEEVSEAIRYAAGQHVGTSKMNLRRGVWKTGAYNANDEPVGYVVSVEIRAMNIHWLCQNMFVPDKFVPVDPPSPWQETEEIEADLKLFRRAKGLEGSLKAHAAQIGEVVCFHNLSGACVKYNTQERRESGKGQIQSIPRTSMLGYDVNTFRIIRSKSWVDVLWQDMTTTRETSTSLVPYENLDEHDMWVGDLVTMKEENVTNKPPLPGLGATPSYRRRSSAAHENNIPGPHNITNDSMEMISPRKVGVVQAVDSLARTAKVRWFKDPKIELVGDMILPGSTTGALLEPIEIVSVYELSTPPALSVKRGDIVLVAPECGSLELEQDQNVHDEEHDRGHLHNRGNAQNTDDFTTGAFLQRVAESLSGMRDAGLLANLSASLSNTSSPQFQHLSEILTQIPQAYTQNYASTGLANTLPSFANGPINWLGEVVDIKNGEYTIRLGALDNIENIKTPIDRLTVVLDADALTGDGTEMEDIMYSDDDSDSEVDDMDNDWISEEIIYEGGRRKDEADTEADWVTDGEGEDIMDVDVEDINDEVHGSDLRVKPRKSITQTSEAKQVEISRARSSTEATTGNVPARFVVLGGEIPADHAFANQPPTVATPAFLRRVKKEHNLFSSLPEGIYMRTWDSRLDLYRALIIGSIGTPYARAPFVFDFHLNSEFSLAPPDAFFHSLGVVGKVNPNLYENGKICLSLLGTWVHQKSSETWNQGSSLSQLLLSLQSLVLCCDPFYNEAGFGVYIGSQEAILNSALYSEKAYILSQSFVKHALSQRVAGLDDILHWLYLSSRSGSPGLLALVVDHIQRVIALSEKKEGEDFSLSEDQLITDILGPKGPKKLSTGAVVLLKKTLTSLEETLERDRLSPKCDTNS